jgi:transposase
LNYFRIHRSDPLDITLEGAMNSELKRKGLEQRRLQAGRLLRQGVSKAEVARQLRVAPSSVSGWAKRLEQGGLAALKSRGRWGRRRGLDDRQRQQLAKALQAGALAAGFATELWTLPRIGVVIQRLFGRRYSDSQVWRILRSMGFSPQRPSRRALERDEAAIAQWKKRRWPALKKTLPNKAER